jgi:predicted signal transduction protein with EAL and GGDEF domain
VDNAQVVKLDNARIGKAVLLWLVLPAMSLWTLAAGVQHVGPAWRAHQGAGTDGVFTATTCIKGDCMGRGTWTSDDGRITFHPVRLYDEPDRKVHLGDRFRAQHAGGSGAVYASHGNAYLRFVTGLALGLAGLACCLTLLMMRLRRRRVERLNRPDPYRFR